MKNQTAYFDTATAKTSPRSNQKPHKTLAHHTLTRLHWRRRNTNNAQIPYL